MSSFRSRCKQTWTCVGLRGADTGRFIDSEKWRETYAGIGVEELVRTFDYKEKPEVFKYYPQYYHKTDKVCYCNPNSVNELC